MNKSKTVMTITGIRPDFIRMSFIFKKLDENFNHILVHTGQHYNKLLSSIFFEDLNIRKPDYVLETGISSNNHYEQLSYLSVNIMDLIKKNNLKPDIILFLGDSNSVCVSLVLKKEGYKIGHIEAGMRSFQKEMLEEINRTVCDHCSDIHFVYLDEYKENLRRENINTNNVYIVGNTVVEPAMNIINNNKELFKNKRNDMILIDIHRRENFKSVNRMKNIIKFGNLCAEKYNLPVKMLYFKGTFDCINDNQLDLGLIQKIDLLPYKKYLETCYHCKFVISDSGTSVEELPLLEVPVICSRDYSERNVSYVNNCSYKLLIHDTDIDNWNNAFYWIEDYANNKDRNTDWLFVPNNNTSDLVIKHLNSFLEKKLR